MILSLLINPAARNPLANAEAIFPAPMKPIEAIPSDMSPL